VQQDFAKAFKWLSKAATHGNADAQYLLGWMYEEGEGLARNYSEAAYLYRTACENRPDLGGAGAGCNRLALLHLEGKGVEQSRVEAYMYFQICCSSMDLEFLESEMTSEEIAQAQHQSDEWHRAHDRP
jgi:hypothetical protein